MMATCLFVYKLAVGQNILLTAIMAVIGRNKTNAAVLVPSVVPAYKLIYPALGVAKVFKEAI
jgi:hypothetical protein